jgi:hypothetical protein
MDSKSSNHNIWTFKQAEPEKMPCLFECRLDYFDVLDFSILPFPLLLSLPDLLSGIC